MMVRRTAVMIAALSLLAPAVGRGGIFHDALHGKWAATITPDPGTPGKDHPDTLTFANGDLFSSDEMTKLGYEPTAYKDRPSPIGVADTWTVTLTNKAGDTAVWTGTEAGGELTGSIAITPKTGAPLSYAFKAERKH